jgi:hypothetical protein
MASTGRERPVTTSSPRERQRRVEFLADGHGIGDLDTFSRAATRVARELVDGHP